MGTQVEIAEQIISQGGDYVLALKGNQGNTHKEVKDHFDFALRQLDLKQAKGWSHHTAEPEKSHGRNTQRTVLATSSLDSLGAGIKARWKGLNSLIVVETESEVLSTGKKRKKERRYYLSSLNSTRLDSTKSSVNTGASRINAIGFWMLPFAKMPIGRGKATRRKTSVSYCESRSTSSRLTKAGRVAFPLDRFPKVRSFIAEREFLEGKAREGSWSGPMTAEQRCHREILSGI